MAQKKFKSIQELREDKGLTIIELAEKTDVKVRTIEKIEQGILKGVYASDVIKLGHYFQTYNIKGLTDI